MPGDCSQYWDGLFIHLASDINSQMQRCSFYMEKKNANDEIIKSAFSDTFKVLSKMNISNITFILVSEWYLNITHGKCALCP